MNIETKINATDSNILIVDDIPANLKVLSAILEAEGFIVRPVPNGRLALQAVKKLRPDLILLDIMMPGMDGFEICRLLKENLDYIDIPVIFISALNDNNDILKALNSGGVDYITKPFHAEEVIARVITHVNLYRQKKKIEEQRRELQELNDEKDKFFSIIAHDLRSPFSGFLGLTQLLVDEIPNMTMEEIQPIVLSLRNSATNVYGLLEDLLKWAKLQRGIIPFDPKIEKLRPIVNESLAVVLEIAKNKEIEIVTVIPEDLIVFADSNLLQTIIRNLASNAVKFTPLGGKISLIADIFDDKMVKVSILDSGIGMDSELIRNLFRKDINSGRRGTSGEQGSGLGLIICKEFIEKHGGELHIESVEGKGSIFSFTLQTQNA
jgi:two-component system, sensor histidine kinase and response regulator